MRFFGKLLLCFALVYICLPRQSLAYECDNRFVTFVNPVRSRQLWIDKSMNPIVSQKEILSKYGFKASWLLQYDVLKDDELTNYLGDFKNDQLGIFLEVSKDLARDAKVYYQLNTPWYSPKVVFLSAYERADRIKLIDTIFEKFWQKYSYYPKSVGAWWIDSFSQKYLKDKYGVTSFLIVADQKTTDAYGVWGQWWGYPYYPSDNNILVPNQHISDSVVIQWAQRHPTKAYKGDGVFVSNNSLQANDYTSLGYDKKYFEKTLSYYLDCRNNIGQITIGMETGMEAFNFLDEYETQLEVISGLDIRDVTMSQFSDEFRDIFANGNPEIVFGEKDKEWILSKNGRKNDFLADQVNYKNIPFGDYFKADKSVFLSRDLNDISDRSVETYYPLYILALLVLSIFHFFKTKRLDKTILLLLSTYLSAFLIFKSFCDLSWCVMYGPIVHNLMFWQFFIALMFFGVFWYLSKYIDIGLYVLSFAFLYILSVIRYTEIGGIKMVGVIWDKFFLLGVNSKLKFVKINLGMLAESILKFDFSKIYTDWKLYLLVLVLIQVLMAFGLKFVFKKVGKNIKTATCLVFLILAILYVLDLFNLSPMLVY